MKNKTIFITGGSSGVGKLLTHELAKDNKIITVARRIDKMKIEFGLNPNVSIFRCDISDMKNVNNLLKSIDALFGEIDVIINCAVYRITRKIIKRRSRCKINNPAIIHFYHPR